MIITKSHTESDSEFSWCPLQWRHNWPDGVSNHQPHDCLLNRLLRRRSKKKIKAPRHWPLRGNSPETGEFPAQMASNAENVSNWWRHHEPCYHCWPRGLVWRQAAAPRMTSWKLSIFTLYQFIYNNVLFYDFLLLWLHLKFGVNI